MVDDRPEDTGPPAESARPKRAGPTIDLEAAEVSGDVRNAAAGAPPDPPPRAAAGFHDVPGDQRGGRRRRRCRGRARRSLVLGWYAVTPPAAPQADTAAINGLAARIASVESKPSAPPAAAPDPAAAARIDSLEKSSASLRGEFAAARAQSEKLTALVNDMKSAPREASPPRGSVCDQRTAGAARTQPAHAGLRDRTGKQEEQNTKPADDMPLRRVVAASLLDVSVRQGEPFVAALAAAKCSYPGCQCAEAAR